MELIQIPSSIRNPSPQTGNNFYGLWGQGGGSAIFVAPQALFAEGTAVTSWENVDGNDVTFTAQLIEQLENALCIDKSRVFADGFSIGN